MLVLPVDGSRPLLILKPPEPQFKDKEKKIPVTDRVTGAPMVEVPVALTMDEACRSCCGWRFLRQVSRRIWWWALM